MKECPHCHKDLPTDSTFCTYCGRPIEKVSMKDLENLEETVSTRISAKTTPLKPNPRVNNWSRLGLILFLFALIALDFVGASIISGIGWDAKFVFILSDILYLIAVVCGAMSLITDFKDKKKGYEPNGSTGFAMVSITMSFYIALLNLTTVILK